MSRIYYSVSNGGDGSAYPVFVDSMEHAELLQYYIHGPWGESCTGSIVIDGELTEPKITTVGDSIEKAEEELKFCTDYPDEYGSADGEKTYTGMIKDLNLIQNNIQFNKYSSEPIDYG